MSKYFYKGESLNIVFTTPVPEAPAVQEVITGFDIKATIQGLTPVIEALDAHSFRLFLSEEQSLKLIATDAPIVITLRKDGATKIGRNIDLIAIDPKFGLPTDPLDDPAPMVLNMATGDISFTLDLKQLPTSPYQMWLVDNPEGTQAEFLAFLQKPASDFVAAFTTEMEKKEDEVNKVRALSAESTDVEYPTAKAAFDAIALREALINKVSAIPAEPTGDEYPDLTLMIAELEKKETATNKVSAIPAEPTGEEFPDLALMQTELGKKADIATAVPATATSAGKAGQIVVGGGFIYHCVSDNVWERAALVTATWE